MMFGLWWWMVGGGGMIKNIRYPFFFCSPSPGLAQVPFTFWSLEGHLH